MWTVSDTKNMHFVASYEIALPCRNREWTISLRCLYTFDLTHKRSDGSATVGMQWEDAVSYFPRARGFLINDFGLALTSTQMKFAWTAFLSERLSLIPCVTIAWHYLFAALGSICSHHVWRSTCNRKATYNCTYVFYILFNVKFDLTNTFHTIIIT